jgi:hypothetical protein
MFIKLKLNSLKKPMEELGLSMATHSSITGNKAKL